MAATSKLVLEFEGTGKTVTFSYKYADPNTTTATIKTLMTGLITNGSIFANPPLRAKSAKIVTTQESSYILDA